MKTLSVIQMVIERLKADGHDGLAQCEGGCGCTVDDIAPCGEIRDDCEAARRVDFPNQDCGGGAECDGTCPFHMVVVDLGDVRHVLNRSSSPKVVDAAIALLVEWGQCSAMTTEDSEAGEAYCREEDCSWCHLARMVHDHTHRGTT